MTNSVMNLDEIVRAALRLSPLDKVRLVERIVSTLEKDVADTPPAPLQTFENALAHLGPAPTDEDIAEVRREMMRNFPREDFDL